MPLSVPGFAGKEVLLRDLTNVKWEQGIYLMTTHFSTDKQLQRERSEHIHSKAEPRHVNQGIILWKIIQNIPLSLVREYHESRYRQHATCDQRK